MFHTKSEILVGDLNLINPRTQGDNGYSLVLVEGTGVNKNILPEYVETIFGNDTILAAKCRSEDEETNLFYKILHNKGHNPISSIRITSQEYSQLQESLLIKYSFFSPLLVFVQMAMQQSNHQQPTVIVNLKTRTWYLKVCLLVITPTRASAGCKVEHQQRRSTSLSRHRNSNILWVSI